MHTPNLLTSKLPRYSCLEFPSSSKKMDGDMYQMVSTNKMNNVRHPPKLLSSKSNIPY